MANEFGSVYINGVTYDVKDAAARQAAANAAASASSALAEAKTYTDNAISGLGTLMNIKGTKTSVSQVKAIASATKGDVWIVTADSSEWVCTKNISTADATAWEMLGTAGTSLDGYVTEDELGSLAYKDSASGSFTPSGSVNIKTTGGAATTLYSCTGTGSKPTHAADSFTPGSFPSISASLTNEILSIQLSGGELPSYTQGVFSQGSSPSRAQVNLSFSGTEGSVSVS